MEVNTVKNLQVANADVMPSAFANESELIQKLYASLTHKEGFQPFLEALGKEINAPACTLTCLRKAPLSAEYFWTVGLPAGFIDEYAKNNMLERDVVFNQSVREMPGGFSSGEAALHALSGSGNRKYWEESYEVSISSGFQDVAWTVVHANDTQTVTLSLMRLSTQEQYNSDELDSVTRLIPHIRQAFQLYQQIEKNKILTSSLASIVNALPKPSIILSDSGVVLYCNPAAKQLMELNNNIIFDSNRLVFLSKQEQNSFALGLVEVIHSSIGLRPFYAASLYIERIGKPNLIFCVTPIENIEDNRGGALVTIYDPLLRTLPSADNIASYFSLTKTEASLCEALVTGASLKDIAEQKNKSEATLRSHLKQVYQKTGFNRQGLLVSSILSALME